MTNPFSYDPLGRVPSGPPAEPPEEFPEPAGPPSRPRVNTFATLSLVYAFVFAPAGAILGHLGLAQIRHTGQQGRQRALAGLTLSYVVIALSVVGLVVWATLGTTRSIRTATPASATTAAPPPPTVAPNDLARLLPGLADVRNLTRDNNLAVGQTWDHVGRRDREGSIDRTECWGSIDPGSSDAYNVEAVFGYRASEFSDNRDPQNPLQVIAGVAAFRDAVRGPDTTGEPAVGMAPMRRLRRETDPALRAGADFFGRACPLMPATASPPWRWRPKDWCRGTSCARSPPRPTSSST